MMASPVHASPNSSLAWTFVNTTALLAVFVDDISNLPTDPPSLYVDLEGIELSRYGTISLLNIFVLPLDRTYLIDIHVLGQAAFSSPSSTGLTLKAILESPVMPKVLFDLRNDCDALYNHYGVLLANVYDVQLLELAAHNSTRRTLAGLAACISRDLKLSASESAHISAVKERGVKLFAPEVGGRYEVFNERPLDLDLLAYCINDVVLLPRLWKLYNTAFSSLWINRLTEETTKRIMCSFDENYQPRGMEKALNPWYVPRPEDSRPWRRARQVQTIASKSGSVTKKEPTIPVPAIRKPSTPAVSWRSRASKSQTPINGVQGAINQVALLHTPPPNDKISVVVGVACQVCTKHFKTEEGLAQHTSASHTGKTDTRELVERLQRSSIADEQIGQGGSRLPGRTPAMPDKLQPDNLRGPVATRTILQPPKQVSPATDNSKAKQLGPVTVMKKFSCSICGKLFKAAPALAQHNLASHAQLPSQQTQPVPSSPEASTNNKKKKATPPKKQHTCLFCHKSFKSNSALLQHKETHTVGISRPSSSDQSSEDSILFRGKGIGYGNQGRTGIYYPGTFSDGGAGDYGLCDKDCGWCGHCMDNCWDL